MKLHRDPTEVAVPKLLLRADHGYPGFPLRVRDVSRLESQKNRRFNSVPYRRPQFTARTRSRCLTPGSPNSQDLTVLWGALTALSKISSLRGFAPTVLYPDSHHKEKSNLRTQILVCIPGDSNHKRTTRRLRVPFLHRDPAGTSPAYRCRCRAASLRGPPARRERDPERSTAGRDPPDRWAPFAFPSPSPSQ